MSFVDSLVATAGYPVVFGLVAGESLGIPLPGETAVIAAGLYAGRTGRLSPWVIFAVAACAAVIGDNVGYWIGSTGGYRLARRYGPKVRLDQRRLKIARYVFDEHGVKVVFLGRFVSILRTYAAFLAGTSKMAWRRFLPANAAGGVIWAALYTFASYLAGNAFRHLSTTLDIVLGVVAAIVIAALLLLLRRRADQLAEAAERRYPGDLE